MLLAGFSFSSQGVESPLPPPHSPNILPIPRYFLLTTGNWVASQRFTPSGYVSAAFPGRTSSTMGRSGAAHGSSSPRGVGGVTHASTLPRDPMRQSAIMEHQHQEDGSSGQLHRYITIALRSNNMTAPNSMTPCNNMTCASRFAHAAALAGAHWHQ